jgi:hypothetical protein
LSRRKPARLQRPPFENRWGAGEDGWRWYCELERLGAVDVRTRLAQQEALAGVSDVEPLSAPLGFVRDSLRYLERHDRQIQRRWRAIILILAAVAAIAALVAATPVVRTWF